MICWNEWNAFKADRIGPGHVMPTCPAGRRKPARARSRVCDPVVCIQWQGWVQAGGIPDWATTEVSHRRMVRARAMVARNRLRPIRAQTYTRPSQPGAMKGRDATVGVEWGTLRSKPAATRTGRLVYGRARPGTNVYVVAHATRCDALSTAFHRPS